MSNQSKYIHDHSLNSGCHSARTHTHMFLSTEVALLTTFHTLIILHIKQRLVFGTFYTLRFSGMIERFIFWAVFEIGVSFFLGLVVFDDFLVIAIIVDVVGFDICDVVLVAELALFVDCVEVILLGTVLASFGTHVEE